MKGGETMTWTNAGKAAAMLAMIGAFVLGVIECVDVPNLVNIATTAGTAVGSGLLVNKWLKFR